MSDADLFAWVILPILIFFARVTDVTLGTLRIIFVSRGKRMLAPILGFFEVLIWIVAIGQLIRPGKRHFIPGYASVRRRKVVGNAHRRPLAIAAWSRAASCLPVDEVIAPAATNLVLWRNRSDGQEQMGRQAELCSFEAKAPKRHPLPHCIQSVPVGKDLRAGTGIPLKTYGSGNR